MANALLPNFSEKGLKDLGVAEAAHSENLRKAIAATPADAKTNKPSKALAENAAAAEEVAERRQVTVLFGRINNIFSARIGL